jgi:LysR family transcriptional regulator of beta-lactamase
MFARQLAAEAICQPFAIEITTGSYWLTRLQSRPETAAMEAFKSWLQNASL